MAAQFGTRLRKGAAATAVAAVVMAALSASQAPGFTADHSKDRRSTEASDRQDANPPADDDYYTDLPPVRPDEPGTSHDLPGTAGDPAVDQPTEAGIPATVLDAYKKAEAELARTRGGCHLPWQLLAAIGHVESGHARGGKVTSDGTTIGKILGPQLNGNGFALIRDTDNGAYDGDSSHDRAVGPMQFIPSTWATSGRDGNGDGREDPNNVYDAALAAGYYLCAGDRDLATTAGRNAAILSYNHSDEYLNTVLSWLEFYRKGTHEVPDGTGTVPTHRNDPGSPSTSPSTPPSVRPTPPPPLAHRPVAPKPPATTPSTPPTKPPTTPKPPTSTPKPPKPPAETKPPAARVARFADSGTGTLAAVAGTVFESRVTARALDGLGKGVSGAKITFTVVGEGDARFAGGVKSVTVTTGSDGRAKAPALTAGETLGKLTVRAALVGGSVAPLDYPATITAREADKLTREGDAALAVETEGAFAPVVAKATLAGKAAPGVAATVTVLKAAGDDKAAAQGPYFKDAEGKPLRTLSLTTGKDGALALPKLFADKTAGEFVLRVETVGGGTISLTLKVTEKPDPSTPAESPSPSPSSSD